LSPLLSLVVPTYSNADGLKKLLTSIASQTVKDIEVVVIDNGATYNVRSALREFASTRVKIVSLAHNSYICFAVNTGVDASSGSLIGVINDDSWLAHDWAEYAVAAFTEYPEIGSLASLIFRSDMTTIDSAGNHLGINGLATKLYWQQPYETAPLAPNRVFGPSNSCAVYRRDDFRRAGGFDDDFIAYLDDIDISFRMQLLGIESHFDPRCKAYHVGNATPKRQARVAFLMERNTVWNMIKNYPYALLRRHHREMSASVLRPLPLTNYHSRSAWALGKQAALVGLPKMIQKRRTIQRSARVPSTRIEALLLEHEVTVSHL